MNARITTGVVGAVTLLLGIAGLFYPERVMGGLGFAVLNAAHAAAVLAEVRATYGGIFLVLGISTLLATADPARHRARLLFLGLIWLGAGTAHLFGVWVDGNPGLFGWLATSFDLAMGTALVLAAQAPPPAAEPAATTQVVANS